MPTLMRLAAVVLGVPLGALAGCSGGARLLEPLAPSGARLTASDFRAPDAGPGGALAAPQADPVVLLDTPTTPTGMPLPTNPRAAANQPDVRPISVEAVAGGPEFSGAVPPPIEPSSLLDVKVGDINGRPVFASDFFADMEDRLIAESRLKTRRAWTTDVSRRIREKLQVIIAGELLRAEALEILPQDSREAGLGRLLDRERAAIQSRAGGSLTEAQRRLMEERGLTLEEYLDQLQDQRLVQLSIEQLGRGIQVSGRDIRNYYERNYEQFNPPATARFRQITVLASSVDAQARIAEALARGEPFADVAARPPNVTSPQAGGLVEITFEGEYGSARLFASEALNAAAQRLSAGQTAGPIIDGPLAHWIRLERQGRTTRSLYEAQLEISTILSTRARNDLLAKTVRQLSERASFTSEDEMVQRLLQIATARYYPPTQGEPAAQPAAPQPGPRRRP